MTCKRNTTCLLIVTPYSKASIMIKEIISRRFNSYSIVGIILTTLVPVTNVENVGFIRSCHRELFVNFC